MTSIAIVGPTGIGKTFNSYLEASKVASTFMCRHLEDLAYYKGEEIIIFDDIGFELINPTQLIKLLDRDFHSTIRILRQTVRIEPTVIKIFTHNDIKAYTPLLASKEQRKAICRRLIVHQCKQKSEVTTVLSAISQMYTTIHQ